MSAHAAQARWTIAAGLAMGLAGSLLAYWGNPANTGICISCFLETAAGALGLHANPRMAYLRPELPAFFLGSFAMKRETPQQIASELWLLASHNLPDDYFEDMLEAIRDTSPADCQELARETIDPDRLTIVVVGDASKLKEELEQLAPVTLIEKS